MKGKKLLAGIISAALVLCTMALPAFAEDEQSSATTSVKVSGIAGFENKSWATIKDAYDEIKPEVEKLAGLGQDTATNENFNNFYTDNGKITWTIKGEQTFAADDDKYLFSFGRAAARYNDKSFITAINIIGEDDTAELILDKNIALPYDWWGNEQNTMSAKISNVIITKGTAIKQIAIGQGYGYKENVEFDKCVINGNFYSYKDKYELNLIFKGCTFNAQENTMYAIVAQGSGNGTITANNCKFYDYTRGVNFQKPNTTFKFTNNVIQSDCSEHDRGAIQLTDGAVFVVTGNTVNVSGGNAFLFHSAATNENVTYTISGNNISAPYLVNDDTNFGVNDKITAYNNIFNDTDIENCMKKEAEEPTKSSVTAIAANGWETDTDSGYYMDGKTKYGMMRFMFKTEPVGTVTASGIKYINANNIVADPTVNGAVNTTKNSSVFQGDIVNVQFNTEGTYYARAYITTENGTFWSAPVGCSVNWNQFFTDYTGGAQ